MVSEYGKIGRCAWTFGVCGLLALSTGCSNPHDFSGTYVVTSGDDCTEDKSGGTVPVLMTISPGTGGTDDVYTAHLSQIASSMGLPIESRPSKLSDDGSLVFEFFEEGKHGLFTAKPSKHVQMKLVVRDDEHLLLENWPITISMPGSQQPEAEFDFVKDDLLQLPGHSRKMPNEIAKIAGDDGVCLLKQG